MGERPVEFKASQYKEQHGLRFVGNQRWGYWDHADWVRFGSVDFGDSGSTSITINYSKGTSPGSRVEIRLGGPEDPVIAEFNPPQSEGWNNPTDITIEFNDFGSSVTGIHDVTSSDMTRVEFGICG